MPVTIESSKAHIVLSLDLKRGEITSGGKYGIDTQIPAWLWVEIGKHYPQMFQSSDIEIEFDIEGDIEIERDGPGTPYYEPNNVELIEGTGEITGETDSVKIEGYWELAAEIIQMWEYEMTNELLDKWGGI